MATQPSGFQGEIAGLSLTDVIQLKGHNKYSGSITVSYGDAEGAIYFVDGEIIHAQLGQATGEEAMYEIVKWPGGVFNMHPEMTTTKCTINCRTDFLLLEALRRLDEERAGAASTRETQAASPPRRTMSKVAARLMDIDTITYAVLTDKEGNPQQDSSLEGESLAAKSMSLINTGSAIGKIMGVGELRSTLLQTQTYSILAYDSKQHYLGIAALPEASVDRLEAEIRSALHAK